MNLYQWLCVLGIPTLLIGVFRYLHTQMKESRKESKALKSGIQALLRAQMIADYNKWSERGYAPIYARDNFANCWREYHALGANGVMDNIRDKFMALPTERPKQAKKGE